MFRRFEDISVGLSITTDSDEIHRLFEPHAPPISARVEALRRLRREGISTYVFAGPLLPMEPARFVELVGDAAGEVLMDRLNYQEKVVRIYRSAGLERYLEEAWFEHAAAELKRGFERIGVPVSVLFGRAGFTRRNTGAGGAALQSSGEPVCSAVPAAPRRNHHGPSRAHPASRR